MDENDFEFRHLETQEDLEQYLELMRKIFGVETGVDKLVRKLIDNYPAMTFKDFFVIKHQNRFVATINLIPVTWSVGDIPIKVAQMGNVATLPEYRRQGLVRRLVTEYHREVAKQGYDLSVLEGIPYFYRQFGYEYAVPLLEETRVRLGQIPDYDSGYVVQPFADGDLPRAMELLEISQRKFYVHTVRDKQVWKIQHETHIASDPEPFEAFTVEADGEMVAYFRMRENLNDKELMVTEVTDVDQQCVQAMLRFLKERGLKSRLETLVACVSYEEPFIHHVVAIGGTRRLPPYAWQVRITDFVRIFEKLKPLLEERLAESTYCHLTETLSFNFRRFTVKMSVENGQITNIQKLETNERSPIGLNPTVFVKLLLGDRSREELEMTYPDVRIDISHKHLLDILFPKKPSYMHSAY